MGEFALIEEVRRRCAIARDDVALGIGDDAALLQPRDGEELAVSMDTLVAGVHFPPGTAPFDIGWKALAVNLSDLAAMGAEPAWAMLALTLPSIDADWLAGFCDGFGALAREHRVALVGGDTTRGPLAITVTVHGFVPRGAALRRDGARAGDRIFVSGHPGDAAAGLACVLGATLPRAPSGDDREYLLQRLNRPVPRVSLGLALRGIAGAAIDVSDGLSQDLGHIGARSGLGAILRADRLPVSAPLARVGDVEQLLRWQLAGGDDYELCCAVPPERIAQARAAADRCGIAFTEIGTFDHGSGVRVVAADGSEIAAPRGGWEHFAA
ncbi:MAG TPA: thiamine-phosphate kinase [Tahibacter sp.]|uniref:thiamine-phosphate kinase n=1 Tax=Tahibacter sp. TaxID=2056211 RepID=UPI002C6C0CA9|nr:thiamine-phosphate kinase [Tahibacter sp.]HSX59735.1 thiamine-phosphate kinase [Tahibacter sp.]